MVDALENIVQSPYEQVRAARAQTRAFRRMAGYVLEVAGGLFSLGGLVRPTPPSSLNGPLGPHRRYAWATTSVEDIKQVRQALGGTFNDVVLASITNGFRELLLSRDEDVERVVRTLVPVSVRPRDAVGQGGRRRHVREQGVRHVRRAPRRHRRPRPAPPRHHRADEGPQGLEPGSGRRGADLHVGLRSADAARAGHAAGDEGGPAQREHHHHERARVRSSPSTRRAGG